MAEDVDLNLGLGVEPDINSATRAGQQIGQAAYEAAKKSFLGPFSDLVSKIPVFNELPKGYKGFSFNPTEKEIANKLIGTIKRDPAGSAASVAAIKSATKLIKDYGNKEEPLNNLSPEKTIELLTLVRKGQEFARIGAKVGRQSENIVFQAGRREAKLSSEYESLTSAYSTAQSALDAAQEGGNTQEVNAARKEVIARARAILKPRYDSVRSDEDTKKYLKAEADNTKALQDSAFASRVLTASISTLAASAMRIGGGMVMSYARQHTMRNVFGDKEQYYEREKTIGTALGSIGGGAAGYIAGLALTPVLGPMAPLVMGSLLSTVGGQVGGLFGSYNQEMLQAKKKTINDIQTRIKASNIYRGAYSPSFGKMVEEMGTATAGDVEKMVGNSQTLAARMMFGQVSENEMFMYSLMPNYFAAAMSGASDAELAAAYANDLNALPPIMRLHVGSSVGGGSAGMAGFAQDRFFGSVVGQAGIARGADRAVMNYGYGWQAGSLERGAINARKMLIEAIKDTEDMFDEEGIYRGGMGASDAYKLWMKQKQDYMTNNYAKDQIINIYIDGQKQEEIKIRGEEAAKAGQMSVYYGG